MSSFDRPTAALVLCGALAIAVPARAESDPDRVDLQRSAQRLWQANGVPWSPRSLHMRARVARAEDPSAGDSTPSDNSADGTDPTDDPLATLGPDSRTDQLITRPDTAADLEPPRRLSDKVIFRFNLGFGLDAGERNCVKISEEDEECQPMASGAELDQHEAYASLRGYGFGDVVIGTRGLGTSSLATYFAAGFRVDQATGRLTSAVPSIHDANRVNEVLVRSGYAEVDHLFEHRLLAPLFLRAGRQFRYGPAIAQFDGVTAGYDTRPFSLGFFVGSRVSMYGFPTGTYVERNGLISGVSARFDMYELKRVPLVLSGSMLSFDKHGHFEGGLAYRSSPDILVRASMRVRGNSFARQRLSLRARISAVTTINAEIENRSRGDWAYDLLVADTNYGATDPRRYLNLGVPLPRLYLNLRAGTVLLDNIDLLLRAAAAIERADNLVFTPSTFSASFVEGGAGLEVRARRAIALGASFLARRYQREPWQDLVDDNDDPDALPTNTGGIGERSFMEGGFTIRFSQGMRTFGAAAEVYGRVYSPQSPYIAEADETYDLRGGGRFQVDGWANQRMHLRVEYDVAFVPTDLAPEIRGVKSLRVITEGTF